MLEITSHLKHTMSPLDKMKKYFELLDKYSCWFEILRTISRPWTTSQVNTLVGCLKQTLGVITHLVEALGGTRTKREVYAIILYLI